MGKRSQGTGKKRFPAFYLILFCLFSLAGCSDANAGTKPKVSYDIVSVSYGESANVRWFDGKKEQEGNVSVSAPVPEGRLPAEAKVPESLKEITPELCSLWFAKVEGDMTGIRPIYACDSYAHPLVRGEKEYRGGGFLLDGGWAAFIVPNGNTDFSIGIGNAVFSAGAETAETETEIETETGPDEETGESEEDLFDE